MPLKDQDLETWKEKIPKHWQVKRLGDVAQYINGRGFKSSEWKKKGIPIIRIQNLNNPDAFYNYAEDDFDEKYQILKGDMLFSWSASIDAYIWKGEKAWLNQHIFKVEENSELCKKFYLFYYLKKIIREFYSAAHGSGMVHITKKSFESTSIPIPPLAEQQFIVAKIEELFSELEKGKEQLETALVQLKVYRQSLLQAAFSGKLTHPDVKEGELPEGWKWVKLGDVISGTPQNGIYKPATEYGSGVPILRIDGFYDGSIVEYYEYKRLKISDQELIKYQLSIDDIVVNRVNSMSHLGKCGLVISLQEPTVFESNIMKLQVDKDVVIPRYISTYLSSKTGLRELTKNAKNAVNQASINQQDVCSASVPICPLKDQELIVQILESKLTVCDKIEETIKQSLAQADVLRQSILKQAFEGKLVRG